MSNSHKRILIVGAGMAGLAAAVELERSGHNLTLCERQRNIGGLSQTIELDNIRFELGPHIYFDKDPEVSRYWRSLPGVEMSTYKRSNRLYYNGKLIKSPLSLIDTFAKLGPMVVSKILWSYAIRDTDKRNIMSAEDWVRANFGGELFERFFKVYNEKIWGMPSSEMAADWAGQRIKTSLSTMIIKSLLRDKDFIIKTFEFPDGGSTKIIQAQMDILLKSNRHTLLLGEEPTSIRKIKEGFEVQFAKQKQTQEFSHIIWTGYLDHLFNILDDDGETDFDSLKNMVSQLKYRSLVLLNYVFTKEDIKNFKEHWIDIHDPQLQALRVTNFSNYSLTRSDAMCGVGIEYNCWENDKIWKQPDSELQELGIQELKAMKLTSTTTQPKAFSVSRISRAYPVYFKGYKDIVSTALNALKSFPNLIATGRNGLYKWNNMHHSVKTGILAARNALGEQNDLQSVKGMVSIGKDSD